jgi:hypothetical protein
LEINGRKGTGFIVESERGVLYVITAAHNLFGKVDPTVPGQDGHPVPTNECQSLDESAITLRHRNTGGDPLYADCIIYVGGPDIGAVRLKPPGRSLPHLRIGWFQSNMDRSLSLIGFAFGLSLSETPETAELDALDGPRNSILLRAANAGGLSGAPYIRADGDVVGVHSGVLTDEIPRAGFVAMVPLSLTMAGNHPPNERQQTRNRQ